jgi:gluconate 2-dehydrogenase gamma chain
MNKVTRRSFVTTAAAATLVPASALLGKSAAAQPTGAPEATPARGPVHPAYLFFDAAEAQFIEAACERLIPADASGPGALDAGVPRYLDRQLGGPWGAGERLYRSEPWQPGTPSPAFQRLAPAKLFRAALRAINHAFEKRATNFAELPCEAQDAFLAALESGEANLGVPAAAAFFDMLLKMTVEGFFSHPLYGRTRDRVAWRMIGFPGAYAVAS